MKATSIPGHELSFHSTGVDSSGKKFILTEGDYKIKGSNAMVHLVDCVRQNGDKSYYFEEETDKKKIVLHFTTGYLKPDIATLTTKSVSVPFVVARNGKIYNLFPSKYWSYHLGPGAAGGNTAMSKECLAIEISNIGPLKKIGNNLVSTYSNSDVYCTIADTQLYTKLATPYRGFQYYAKFTSAQYDAVALLLKFLSGKYTIPLQFVQESKRYNTMTANEFTKFKGVVSHVNCRADKCDIGPAFDWNKLIQLVS
jgi:N-acetylmuramoyl-L-alanine amidase